MVKRIKLNRYGGFLDDREPFVIAENEGLELAIETPYGLDRAYLALENGKMRKTFKAANPFRVPEEFLLAGELRAEVRLMGRGEEVKRIGVEPVVIREADGELSGLPAFEALRGAWAAYREETEARVRAAEERAQTAEKGLEQVMEQVRGLELRMELLEKHYDPLTM